MTPILQLRLRHLRMSYIQFASLFICTASGRCFQQSRASQIPGEGTDWQVPRNRRGKKTTFPFLIISKFVVNSAPPPPSLLLLPSTSPAPLPPPSPPSAFLLPHTTWYSPSKCTKLNSILSRIFNYRNYILTLLETHFKLFSQSCTHYYTSVTVYPFSSLCEIIDNSPPPPSYVK